MDSFFWKQLIDLYFTCDFEHILSSALKANLAESYDHIDPWYILRILGIL